MHMIFKAASVAVIAAIPVACAQPGGSGPSIFSSAESERNLTPAERRLRRDNQVYNETLLGGVAQGAIVGALLGGLFGLASGKLKNAAQGAAIGAAAGGLFGGLDGWRVATRQEASSKNIREIELATDKVVAENRAMQQSLDNIDVVIAATTRNLRTARAGYRSKTVSLDEMRAREARARSNVKQTEQLIDKLEDRQQDQEEIASSLRSDGYNTRQIDQEISETRRQIRERERERELLAAELDREVIRA
jgi:hypothetical protein